MQYPKGLPRRYRGHWRQPWRRRAKFNWGFRSWLWTNGYLTPHFTRDEARCKDGTRVPESLRRRAQAHAFKLERLRHKLGDVPVAITSWFRTRTHNTAIGGASQSRHMWADATDHPVQWVAKVGREKFDRIANQVFRNGGLGQYPSGARHTDSRGVRARWTSF